jgi:hypothetical protein
MSYYFCSVPKNIALMMKDKYDLDTFVETGTYIGKTAEWASKHFDNVHTIEMNEQYYSIAELSLIVLRNVTMHLNDSRIILPFLIDEFDNRKVLFYLDAHWSNGAKYGRPLVDSTALDEILIINDWDDNKHVIIVDDAHRFGTDRWPTKIDIVNALENDGRRYVRELLDVLVATPRRHNASFDDSATQFIPLGRIRN